MSMPASVMTAGHSDADVVWDILGQTYRPVAHTGSCFAFDTLFPPGTFVPPHIHHEQDEFIRVLDGSFELFLDGAAGAAHAGDLVRLPRGIAHGIFNRSATPTRALFWVAPALGLYELFTKLDRLADPAEVVKVAAGYGVDFLPPPP